MKRNKFLRMAASVLISLAVCIYLVSMLSSVGECPYSRCISRVTLSARPASEKSEYISDIEEVTIDHEDPFELAEVKGWLVEPKGEYYGKADAKLLLYSDDTSYSVRLFWEKRTDVIYMDQSDPNSKDLNVGFMAYFPIDELEKGDYTIGFLVNSGGNEDVILTSDTISV